MEHLRRLFIRSLIAITIFYFAVMGLLYSFQDNLVYLPDLVGRELHSTPADIKLTYQDVSLITEDGIKLHSWFIPAEKSNAVALVFHGNAGNISHRLDTIQVLNGIGLSVFIFDYRGYGQSEGEPNESGTYRDSRAAWRYLLKHYQPNQIVLFGRSMGAGVASELARELSLTAGGDGKPAALIMESTFTSIPDLGREQYPVFPVDLLATIHYDSLTRMEEIKIPTLILHSPDDEIIPYAHGRALFEAAREPKQFHSLRGDHNTGFKRTPEYPRILKDFLSLYI